MCVETFFIYYAAWIHYLEILSYTYIIEGIVGSYSV